jgi:hypothetical protein
MSYTIELKRIPVQTYMEILKNQNLLPGRRILLENIEMNFQKIINAGIGTLCELKNSLSTPLKISAFSTATTISEDYLVILKREMSSLEQKPVLISDFPGISGETVSRLSDTRVKTSKDFFDLFHLNEDIAAFSEKTGISEEEINELLCLCNLVRINGVGSIAAKIMYESGYKSVVEVARANAAVLLGRISDVNSSKQYYKAKLGEKDMQFTIDFANLILNIEENH